MKGFPFGFAGLLCAAMFSGVTGVLLLMTAPWGLNFSLWFGSILAVALWNATRPGLRVEGIQRAALISALVFTILFSWRDFQIEFFLIIFFSLALASETAFGRMMRLPFTRGDAQDEAEHALLVSSTEQMERSAEKQTDKRVRTQIRIIRTFLVVVPVFFFSGWYVIAHDAISRQWVGSVTDPERVVTQILWCGVYAWVAVVVWRLCPNLDTPRREKLRVTDYLVRLGAIGIGIAMLVAALPDFCVSQLYWIIRTFYRVIHGAPLNESWFDTAHAASRGSDDVLWVMMVIFIGLIYGARALRRSRVWSKRVFKILSGLVIMVLVLVQASAIDRLIEYINMGGLTRNRLHASIFFAATVLAFLGLYVAILRERIRAFAWGFLLSGYGLIFLVTAVNTDAIIVRTNLHGPFSRELDTEYLGWLGVDAVPAILDEIPHLKDTNDQSRLNYLARQYVSMTENRDWRGWTFGWYQARKALRDFDFDKYDFEGPQKW